MKKVLVTGANGFVGRHLLSQLTNYQVRLAVRAGHHSHAGSGKYENIGFDLEDNVQDFDQILNNIDVVIHLAGIAHKRSVSNDEYISSNTRATARLVAESVKRGIKRFIFLSTIKVHGESTGEHNGRYYAFTESTETAPQDSYSRSKLDAEHAIINACNGSDTEYVILRPPLIFGPDVKANFLKLLQLIASGFPLPFAAINNRRSLIYVENLCSLVKVCIDHPSAGNQVFVVKDYDYATPSLITNIARAFGTTPRLFPLPIWLLRLLGKLVRQDAAVSRLTESLFVDNSKLYTQLGWNPPVTMDTAICRTVTWYIERGHSR